MERSALRVVCVFDWGHFKDVVWTVHAKHPSALSPVPTADTRDGCISQPGRGQDPPVPSHSESPTSLTASEFPGELPAEGASVFAADPLPGLVDNRGHTTGAGDRI